MSGPNPISASELAEDGQQQTTDSFEEPAIDAAVADYFSDLNWLAGADPLLASSQARRRLKRVRLAVKTGMYTLQQNLEGRAAPRIRRGNNSLILLSTYDYLGLIGHARIEAAAKDAVDAFGTGTGGVRLLTGTNVLHRKLESKLATFLGVDAAMTFSSGYAANLGVISALFGPQDLIVADAFVHASIKEGCRLAQVPVVYFAHNDPADLRRCLAEAPKRARVCIVVEGIYSMDGDICPLPEIVSLKRRYGASLMVDEAHSLGVLGRRGRGVAEHFSVSPSEIDLFTGSLNKAIPANGGFVASRANVIVYLQHGASTFIFSGALAPAMAAASTAAIDVLKEQPDRVARLWRNGRTLRDGLAGLGYDVPGADTPLIPVVTGDTTRTYQLARDLLDEGVAVSAVVFPAVPLNSSRLRVCATAAQDKDTIREALDAFQRVRNR